MKAGSLTTVIDIVDTVESPVGSGLRSGRTPRLRLPLSTLEDIRREMARNYRAVKAGEIDSAEGSRRTFMLAQLGKVIELSRLEARIEALEAATVHQYGAGGKDERNDE